MKKMIFHGSQNVIEKPIYGYGRKDNDYGLGFYCTDSFSLAAEWAVDFDKNGYVNKYEINMHGLKVLYLNKTPYGILHWLTILIENRTFNLTSPLSKEAKDYLINNFHIDYRSYDIIVGYRADDSYFTFAKDFLSGIISYRQLNKAMKLGGLGEQIVLISEKAFKRIAFLEAEYAEKDVYFSKKMERDVSIRRKYVESKEMKRQKDDLYIVQILDEEMKPDDSHL